MAKAYAKLLSEEGELSPSVVAERARNSHFIKFSSPQILGDFLDYKDKGYNDKYKHAMINCLSAQRGLKDAIRANNFSRLKEFYDVSSGNNTPVESGEDMYANLIGRYLGLKYPQGDCDEMVQRYIKKTY